ncbi:MAG: hypothetical protein IM584_05075 [Chitinophagaceae bacterium]|nr:hypothetical protein [Chitinophagaceae bacterium]MCA6455489.1 hypothetical protein [Chitinophagaceae bacterium]MCA6460576.1 hypothetical protein [Chitinophagaceae bacterium]MCA6464078.1 hypothetical protein [Chitinophagaceae bacterium]
MSNIVTEMIVEKLDQVILLLQVQKPATPGEENWVILNRQIDSIRQGMADQQLQGQKGARKQDTILTVITGLESQIKALPGRATVEHKHHLHKGIWIAAGLLMITILLSWQWLVQIGEKEQFRENDIKYRYLKAYGDREVRQLCHRTDSIYVARKDDFEDKVLSEEKRMRDWVDSMRLAGERQGSSSRKQRVIK